MTSLKDKPWLKNYDPQVPHDLVFPNQALQQFLSDSAKKHPGHPALVMRGKQISYRELDEMTDQIAAALYATGFQKGDRAAIFMPNTTQFIIVYYGILKAGGIVVAANTLFSERELEWQLDDCGADTVFVLSMFYDQIKTVQRGCGIKRVIVTNLGEFFPFVTKVLFSLFKDRQEGHRVELRDGDIHFQDFLKLGAKAPAPRVYVTGDDTALLQYSGGTSGRAKGAIARHRNLVANVYMMRAWLHDWQEKEEVVLAAIPLFHSYGMVLAMHLSISIAATLIVVPNPRDTDALLELIDKYKPTIFPGVPSLFHTINHHPDVRTGKYDLSSIRVCISGAAPLMLETKEQFEQLSGGRLVEGYGMTETHVATHCNPIYGRNIAGSIGLPLPGVECRIVDVEDPSKELDIGQSGELVVKTPTLMAGYWNRPQRSEEVLKDGWYHTGDIVTCDENGYFYIRDRKKEMIIAGGFNIYPRELEEQFARHPAVAEVAVIGVMHRARGEQPVAFIVLEEGASATVDELIEYGKQHLARYKYPREIRIVDHLPKSDVGTVLKRQLYGMAPDIIN